MARIRQFNYVQGQNQIYVEDLANISNGALDAISNLPWTTPLAIANASKIGQSIVMTKKTIVSVNGVIFGTDSSLTLGSSQYLYAVCEYDTSSPREDTQGDQYFQSVVRYLKVSDTPLSETDYSNASIFPGIGNYLIISPNFTLADASIKQNANGTFCPFDVTVLIPTKGITATQLGDGSVTSDSISSGAVTAAKIGDNAVTFEKIANSAVNTPMIANGAVTPIKVSSTPFVMSQVDGTQNFGSTAYIYTDRVNVISYSSGTGYTLTFDADAHGALYAILKNNQNAARTVTLKTATGTTVGTFQLSANSASILIGSVSNDSTSSLPKFSIGVTLGIVHFDQNL